MFARQKSDTQRVTAIRNQLNAQPTPINTITLKTPTKMKNFFSQTWVVALLCAAVLVGVGYLVYKEKSKDAAIEDGDEDDAEGANE